MSKRSFLRKSAMSLTATLGLGGTVAYAADITLNGNTLQIGSRTVDRNNALRGAYYHFGAGLTGNPPQGAFDSVTGIRALEASEKAAGTPNQEADLVVNLDFNQDPSGVPFGAITGDTVDFGTTDQIFAVWSGEIVVDPSAAGLYGLATASDDGSVIHIDGNYALNNNAYQGRTRRDSTYVLTPGVHSIVMGWYEGGGGANMTAYMSRGPTNQPEEILNPSSPLPGLTFRKVTYTTDLSQAGMNVIVTANSGINIDQDTPVPFGTLNLGNHTLTFNGVTTASFTGTTVGNSPTFNIGSGRVQTGALTTGAGPVTINKTGGGELHLNRSSPLAAGTVFNVQAGTLTVGTAGAGSLGGGSVTLSGGTLSVDQGFFPSTPDSANRVGWSGLDTKANFDAALAGLTPLATRSLDTPVDLEINFPRGDANLDNGGTNDFGPEQIFNVDGANLNVPLSGNDNFVARFTGKLNVTAAGQTRFGLASNDGSAMFLDTDLGAGQNWVKVADNNRFTGTGGGDFQGFNATGDGTNNSIVTPQPGPINLSAGNYDFAVGFFNARNNEGGIELYWVPSGAATHSIIPGSSMSMVSGDFYQAIAGPLTNAVTVTANSTINAATANATVNTVTINPGVTLNTTGTGLTLTNVTAAGAGTVTISPATVTNVVNLNDAGNAVTFAKGGTGQLVLTRTGGPGLGTTSKLDVQAGSLVATQDATGGNTLGGAPVTLSGGTLELRTGITKFNVSDAQFDGTFIEDAIDPGSTPGSNYLVFRGLTGTDFNLTSTPLIGNPARAPVNGIELRRGNSVIAVKFAANETDGPLGDDGNSEVNGPAGVFNTANWNNFGGQGETVPQALNIDVNGTASPSTARVTWNSNNTWSSTGRGEENIAMTVTDPEDRDLMAGYLDTGGVGGVGVTIGVSGLPASLASGFDAYVYIKGGINGRGGNYTVGGGVVNFASNINATQNSTIDVTGAGSAQLGNVSAEAGRTLTLQGRRLNVNDVSTGAGGVVAFTSTAGGVVAGSISGAGTLRAGPGVTVDLTKTGSAASGSPLIDIARGAIVRAAPGSGNTFGGAAVSAISNEGLIHAASGIMDLSGAMVTTTNVPGGFGPGLFGGRVEGATNATDFPTVGDAASVDLRLSRAQTTNNAFFGGDNGTWVYTGEVRLQDTDGDGIPGPVAFGEQFDDFVLLKIDGQELINNNAWQVPHSSGAIERADNEPDGNGTPNDGWFSFEARFGQGGGGVGPNTGWNIGFGIDTDPSNGFDAKSDPATGDPNANRAQYVEPIEPGNMSLFRIANNPVRTGNVQVDAGATLRVGALVGSNDVNIAPGGRLELHNGTSRLAASELLDLPGAPGAATATWDMTDADLIAVSSAATKAADFAAIYADLKQAFTNGAWTGMGITSSTAAANAMQDTGVTVVDNALLGYTDFGGRPVDANSILLKYTYYGDIDQNGQVDADDLTVFANNFGRTSGATQVDGDIDFNGTVDADDLTIFANNFNKGVGAPLAVAAASVQAVPEPGSLVLAGLGAAGILAGIAARRRNKRQE